MATVTHWTGRNVEDFVFKISSDFVFQLVKKMESEPMNQKELAGRLGVSMGRVSQVLNNPGNLTLKKCVQYARALGMKASLVAYDDADPDNNNGPINSEIFFKCWQRAGSPRDFFELAETTMQPQMRSPMVNNCIFYMWESKAESESGGEYLPYDFPNWKIASTGLTIIPMKGD